MSQHLAVKMGFIAVLVPTAQNDRHGAFHAFHELLPIFFTGHSGPGSCTCLVVLLLGTCGMIPALCLVVVQYHRSARKIPFTELFRTNRAPHSTHGRSPRNRHDTRPGQDIHVGLSRAKPLPERVDVLISQMQAGKRRERRQKLIKFNSGKIAGRPAPQARPTATSRLVYSGLQRNKRFLMISKAHVCIHHSQEVRGLAV